jgi:hypothetical protein
MYARLVLAPIDHHRRVLTELFFTIWRITRGIIETEKA